MLFDIKHLVQRQYRKYSARQQHCQESVEHCVMDVGLQHYVGPLQTENKNGNM